MRRDPRVSVVVTSSGTAAGPGKAITIKGRCRIHEENEVKEWFYPAFAAHLYGKPEHAQRIDDYLSRIKAWQERAGDSLELTPCSHPA